MTDSSKTCLSCGAELKTMTKVVGKDVCGQCYGKGAFRPCFICSKAEKENMKISQILSTSSCKKHFKLTCSLIFVIGILAVIAGSFYARSVDGNQKILMFIGIGMIFDSIISLIRGRSLLKSESSEITNVTK